MTKVNDRRRVTPESDVMTADLDRIQSADPEKTFALVTGAMRDYLRQRCPPAPESADKSGRAPFTIPSPEHRIVDEIARYVVEMLIKSTDLRSWILIPVKEFRVGDVFTRYAIGKDANGVTIPVDEEVTVMWIKPTATRSKMNIRFRSHLDRYGDLDAPADYLFYVHRPTSESIRAELDAP